MYSLLSHNTFGIDVSSTRFFEYASVEELLEFIAQGALVTPFLHIGGGSNLLFTQNYDGLVLHSVINGIEVTQEDEDLVSVRVGAGVIWDDFVAYCVEHNWYGAENLSLIPGEVGASAVQNIGAYGVEVKDIITAVETVNIHGERRVYRVDECEYAYRSSMFKESTNKSMFVTYVHFKLSKHEDYKIGYGAIKREIEKYPELSLPLLRKVIIEIRESKLPDPKVVGNAGSFFMNPIVSLDKFESLACEYPQIPYYDLGGERIKIPAGWLIEQCGWKGKSLGPAAVHDKQALVIVNLGGATGKDIIRLAEAVKASVYEKFGIKIYPEVNFI